MGCARSRTGKVPGSSRLAERRSGTAVDPDLSPGSRVAGPSGAGRAGSRHLPLADERAPRRASTSCHSRKRCDAWREAAYPRAPHVSRSTTAMRTTSGWRCRFSRSSASRPRSSSPPDSWTEDGCSTTPSSRRSDAPSRASWISRGTDSPPPPRRRRAASRRHRGYPRASEVPAADRAGRARRGSGRRGRLFATVRPDDDRGRRSRPVGARHGDRCSHRATSHPRAARAGRSSRGGGPRGGSGSRRSSAGGSSCSPTRNGRPGRDFDASHAALVESLGFSAAVTTAPGAAAMGGDRFQLPRFTPWDREPVRFLLRLVANCRRGGPVPRAA